MPQALNPTTAAATTPIAQAETVPMDVAPATVAPATTPPTTALDPDAPPLELFFDDTLPEAAAPPVATAAPTTAAGIAGGVTTTAADAQAALCATTSPATNPATPPKRRRPRTVGLSVVLSLGTSTGSFILFSSPTICVYNVRNDSRARIVSTETCLASSPMICAISAGLLPSTALSQRTRR